MNSRLVLGALVVGLCVSNNAIAVERLFTSLSDRQILDTKRFGRTQQTEEQVQFQRQSLQLNGVVRINQMPPNIWLNGSSSDLKKDDGLSLGKNSSSRAVELEFVNRKATYSLKPGQKLDLLTGRKEEAFNQPQLDDKSTDKSTSDLSKDDDAAGSKLNTALAKDEVP